LLSDRDIAVRDLVRGAIDELEITQARVVARLPISEALAEALLGLPSIVALFHAAPAGRREGEYVFDPASGPLSDGLAVMQPRDLILLGSSRLGARNVLHLTRNGARRVIAYDNCHEAPALLTIYDLFAKEIKSALRERAMQVPQRINSAFRLRAMPRLAGMVIRQLLETMETALRPNFRKWISDTRGCVEIPKSAEPGPIVHAIGSLGAGGSERQLRTTVANMQTKIDGTKILCISPKDEAADFFARELSSERVEVIWNISGRHDHFFAPQRILQCTRQLESISLPVEVVDTVSGFVSQFERLKPAVVHSWLDYANVTAGLAAVLCGVPRIVLGCRSMAPFHFGLYRSYFHPLYRALLGSPSVVITANSVAGAHDYASWLGIDPARIEVINNAVDLSAVSEPSAEKLAAFRREFGLYSDPVVGTVGRLAEEKRPFLWLQVACEVLKRRPRTKFLWVGGGPAESQLRREIASLGIGDRVMVAGVRKDIGTVLSAMSVFLLTSRQEGLPNVLIEAQAFGVPVVSAAVGGALETFQEGITGMGVRSSRADDYAAAITHFLDDASARDRAKQYGPMLVKERFSVDDAVEKMLALYRSKQSPLIKR
jgi:glycosyltransferase involved in cell wall biosynthesis